MENYKYIAHHGVKGMHWGEWNEETAARYGHIKKASVTARVRAVEAGRALGKTAKKYANNAKSAYINGQINKAVNTGVGAVSSFAKEAVGRYSGIAIASLAPKTLSVGNSFVASALSNPYITGGVALGSLAIGVAIKVRANKKQSGNAKWTVSEPQKSSGSYTTGSKEISSTVNDAKKAYGRMKRLEGSFTNQEGFDKYLKTLGPIDRAMEKSNRSSNQRDYRAAVKQFSSRIKSLSNSGHTNAEIAKMLNISESTVSDYLNW